MKDGVEAKDGGKLSLGSVEGVEPFNWGDIQGNTAFNEAYLLSIQRDLEESQRYHEALNVALGKLHADMKFVVDTLDARSHDQAVSNAIARLRKILDNEDPVTVYG